MRTFCPLAQISWKTWPSGVPLEEKEESNLLVMSAGNYSFSEFVKVGVPLTIIMWLTLTGVLSAMYF